MEIFTCSAARYLLTAIGRRWHQSWNWVKQGLTGILFLLHVIVKMNSLSTGSNFFNFCCAFFILLDHKFFDHFYWWQHMIFILLINLKSHLNAIMQTNVANAVLLPLISFINWSFICCSSSFVAINIIKKRLGCLLVPVD